MLGTTLSFVAVNGAVRAAGSDLPSVQAAFLRFLFGVVLLAPVVPGLLRRRFPARIWGLFGLRGLFHAAAVIGWFYAMVHIPMAEVTAINYLNPVLVTVGGALLFKERFSWQRGAAVAVALIGTLIVLRPGLRAVEAGHLAQLFAAFMFAGSYLAAKRLSQDVPAGIVVAVMSLSVAVILAPAALMVWQTPSGTELAFLAMSALFATLAHYCMSRAFDCAPLTVTQPVIFLQLVWATLLGTIVFGDRVDPFVLLGGGLIIAAIAYLTFRDARRARQARK
ncbi:EamA family transporter [Falsirhodobacter algicola]|uniref:EamA family transporter n=2 Tax=Falsirhodobacter algicola TaxID=2692330 RepID=A0A8J8MVF7_9RHOB|nr:EamA family transporter [Falsirhodobacter algicola]